MKSISEYKPDNYSLKTLINRKIDIRRGPYEIEHCEIPYYQTKIYPLIFSDCFDLKTVKLHDKIKEIGSDAFYNCRCLQTITIPSSVTKIGKNSFKNCDILSSIEYNGEIDGNVVEESSNLSSIPKIKSLEVGNFDKCKYLQKIELNDTIEYILV